MESIQGIEYDNIISLHDLIRLKNNFIKCSIGESWILFDTLSDYFAVNEAKFMLSVDSCKCLAQLAAKLPITIAPHSPKAIPELVKRAGFRQKALVDACNKAVDAMVPTIKFDKFLDLMTELVEDKKPDIVMEAGELIARSVPRCSENERPKKLPNGLVNALGKAFACSKPEARDAAMKATGALLKLTNDRNLQAQVDKLDNPKKNKVGGSRPMEIRRLYSCFSLFSNVLII